MFTKRFLVEHKVGDLIKRHSDRSKVTLFSFALVGFIFLIRLFYLQVINDSYKLQAEDNVSRKIITYPSRGLIFDRNDKILVNNTPVYDIMVVPSELGEIDTTKFCSILEITREQFDESLTKAKKYSRYRPSTFLRQIPPESYTKLQEYLHHFPGFFSQVRTKRSYPYKNAPHILGYLSEVNKSQMDSSEYYGLGDYIGISGVEQAYETELRGIKGKSYRTVNALSKETGQFNQGANDIQAVEGKDLHLSLDIDLQILGDSLMKNKIGSIVAIEPATGEILAMNSNPFFDPNSISGRERGKSFTALNKDSLKPLFNRALMAQYPPGSTFKPIVGLVALEKRIIPANYYYACTKIYETNNLRLSCSHYHTSAYNIAEAIRESCNPYFWHIFRETIDRSENSIADSYNDWVDHVLYFGIGELLDVDIPGEEVGNIPDASFYDDLYGSRRWGSSTILSLGIGQGELTSTPLQLCHYTSVIANRGKIKRPHIVRKVNEKEIDGEYDLERKAKFSEKNFEHIIEGLHLVVTEGTGKSAQIPGVEVCGKTGTAQNPHGDDHSIFIGFAPKENPQIAVAVVVENAGFGSTYAAPIAGLIMEKYLNGSIAENREWLVKRITEDDLINKTIPELTSTD